MLERAIHGVEVPVYSYGKLVGKRRVYNDRTALFMLRNYDGQMSGGASGLPIRLKRIVEEEVANEPAPNGRPNGSGTTRRPAPASAQRWTASAPA